MSLIKKLYPESFRDEEHSPNVELYKAVRAWHNEPTDANLSVIIDILHKGEAQFYLVAGSNQPPGQPDNGQPAEPLVVGGIWEQNGKLTLSAFTDEQALWNVMGQVPHLVISTRDVLRLCEVNGISAIVINNLQSDMFILTFKTDGQEAKTPSTSGA